MRTHEPRMVQEYPLIPRGVIWGGVLLGLLIAALGFITPYVTQYRIAKAVCAQTGETPDWFQKETDSPTTIRWFCRPSFRDVESVDEHR